MSLLVTAFSRFDGGRNCSEALLIRLAARRRQMEQDWGGPVALQLLDVDTDRVEAALVEALERTTPTHLLLTGQAAGRTHLSFERVARNRRDLQVPDEAGRSGALGKVAKDGPDQLEATWPDIDGAIRALAAAGLPAATSDDAGAHLCNQTLYLALLAARRGTRPFAATFLHLPLLPEQLAEGVPAALRHESCFVMPLDEMERAVRIFLRHTAEKSLHA